MVKVEKNPTAPDQVSYPAAVVENPAPADKTDTIGGDKKIHEDLKQQIKKEVQKKIESQNLDAKTLNQTQLEELVRIALTETQNIELLTIEEQKELQLEIEKELTQSKLAQLGDFVKDNATALFEGEKWKTETGKQVLRAATGVGVLWGAKKAFDWMKTSSWMPRNRGKKNKDQQDDKSGDKKEEKKDNTKSGEKEKNRWQRNRGWVVAGSTAGIGAAYFQRDKLMKLPLVGPRLDKLFNPQQVSFDDSFVNFSSDIQSSKMELEFGIQPGAKYEKVSDDVVKLTTYGSSIEINTKTRTVDGMEGVVFKDYKELLHAANIINFCASNFRGVCKNNAPFDITASGGDLLVQLLDSGDKEFVSGLGIPMGKIVGGGVGVLTTILGLMYGGKALGAVGAVVGAGAVGIGHMADTADTLSQICPTLNSYAAKQALRARLNRLPGLTQGDQQLEGEKKHDIQPLINEVITEMKDKKIDSDFDKHGNARYLQAEKDPIDPKKYYIWSWKRNLGPTILHFDNNRIRIEGLNNIDFDPKEGIRIANLTNKIKSEYAGKGYDTKPFIYRGGVATFSYPGLYFHTTDRRIGSGGLGDYRIIKQSTLKENFPSLYGKIESNYIPYLEAMVGENNSSLWR